MYSDLHYLQNVLNTYTNKITLIIKYGDFNTTIYNVYDDYIIVETNVDNHMSGFIQGLNYIYSHNIKTDYIFKLYHHRDFVINYNTLHMNIDDNIIIGYPAIKYDYSDNYYVNLICDELSILIDNLDVIKLLQKKISSNEHLQISRKHKEWVIISKKTRKSDIPSSIFITKYSRIPFEIIDIYDNISFDNCITDHSYDENNYVNALTKILTIF